MGRYLVGMATVLMFNLALQNQALGQRTVTGGGSLLEIIFQDEFSSFQRLLNSLEEVVGLDEETKQTLMQWKSLNPEFFFDEISEPDFDIHCNKAQIIVNEKYFLRRAAESDSWQLQARLLIAKGYQCLTKTIPRQQEKMTQLLERDSQMETIMAHLVDIYKPQWGLYIRTEKGDIAHVAFIDTEGRKELEQFFIPSIGCSKNETTKIINMNFQNKHLEPTKNSLIYSLDINLRYQCLNLQKSNPIASRLLHAQIELETNLKDAQTAFDSPNDQLRIRFKSIWLH